MTLQEQYNELSYYTLLHGDPSFIHQHIVDAYIAQTADANRTGRGTLFLPIFSKSILWLRKQ